LAGPVAVGVVKMPVGFDISKYFPDAADSKILSEQKREEIYARMLMLRAKKMLNFTVRFSSAAVIDRIGITKAVHRCIYKGIETLAPKPAGIKVLLDGLLHAPKKYKQKTIICGDATEPVISLASIAAKVHRDRLMKRYAKTYPTYGFEKHKGYGTALHQKNIQKFGLSVLHRRSYCKKLGAGI